MGRFINMLAATIPMLAATLAMGGGSIVGSKHDFSGSSFSDGAICKPCHTPHNADLTVTGRLWAHTMSSNVSYVYHGTRVSPADGTTTQDAANGSIAQTDLDGASRLCLSCHDGTVALDSFKGSNHVSNGIGISGSANLGTDLSNDHPVGLNAVIADYKAYYKPVTGILAANKLKLVKTSVPYAAGGKDVNGVALTGNEYAVSCVTCHDVHNGQGVDAGVGLLRVSNAGSALCLSCHNK